MWSFNYIKLFAHLNKCAYILVVQYYCINTVVLWIAKYYSSRIALYTLSCSTVNKAWNLLTCIPCKGVRPPPTTT